MELQITGKNVKLIPSARGYIERKLNKLSRHLPSIIELKVEISEEKTKSPEQRFVAQVTVDSSGTLLRGEERGEDLFIAVDKVVAMMDRQIERYKGKHYDKGRGNSLARSAFKTEAGIDESLNSIARVKRFQVTSMPPMDAVEQMELLGLDFFLFFNADSDRLNLLYRRKEGNYGLIEPVFE